MKKLFICLMFATMAFAKEPEVKRSTTEVPENRLDQITMWGVKMGEEFNSKKLLENSDSPISIFERCRENGTDKIYQIGACFHADNMVLFNLWLQKFIDEVGRPSEFKHTVKDGFEWKKFTEDNTFTTNDINLIRMFFGKKIEFDLSNFRDIRWIKKSGNKVHVFEIEYHHDKMFMHWYLKEESDFKNNYEFDALELPKAK